MADNVIELKATKACPECGHEPGDHEDTCTRSRANMQRLADIRRDKIARGEIPRHSGGRKRKLRVSRAELEEIAKQSAGDMLYGDRADAVALLRKQLKSKDEKVAQRAALEILAYTDGKPTQRIEQTNDNVTEVIYRSAALRHEEFIPDAADGS